MSQAMVYGIWRTRRTAEPPIGYRLHLASEMPNLALSPSNPDIGALQDLGTFPRSPAFDRGDERLGQTTPLQQTVDP